VPARLQAVYANVHEEVARRYYGCGLVAPELLEGRRVLDLGCGAGRDVYALAQLVGPRGEVIGVDTTPEQLAVARAHLGWHMERFGHARPTVRFVEGEIETLDRLGVAPGSVDVVVSNCVVNLSGDKPAVLRGVHDLLAPGGELHFADVYCDRRLPASLREDPVLLGECLAGALYWNDFLTLAKAAGFRDPRLVTSRPIAITDAAIAERLGAARFFSATYRLFRLDELEPACEDHGQAVVYRGGIPGAEDVFVLDAHHRIERGRVFPVCGNTFRMLHATRFAPWFDFHGDFSRHFGIFPGCGTSMPFATDAPPAGGACC
jgi:arsenite methyltransferase